MKPARDPALEIAIANPWYVEDQFAVQLGSPHFRAVVENRWRVFVNAIDDWVRTNGTRAPDRLLDAGCGDGINLSFLTRLVGERHWQTTLTGADYSPLRLDRARSRASAIVRASVTSLGFGDLSFDVVICNQVLEHVPDYRLALSELRRVLRPGGLLLIGVPNEGCLLGRLRNHVLQRSILHSTDHVNMFTKRTLVDRLTGAGFDVVRVESESFFVPHTVVHGWLNRRERVRRLLDAIGSTVPACAAGLLVAATRPH